MQHMALLAQIAIIGAIEAEYEANQRRWWVNFAKFYDL